MEEMKDVIATNDITATQEVEAPTPDETPVKRDIHNIKEVLHLVFCILIPILKKKKESGKFELLAFIESEEFKAAIKPAFEGIGEVVLEIKDFGLDDGLDAAAFIVNEIKEIIKIYA